MKKKLTRKDRERIGAYARKTAAKAKSERMKYAAKIAMVPLFIIAGLLSFSLIASLEGHLIAQLGSATLAFSPFLARINRSPEPEPSRGAAETEAEKEKKALVEHIKLEIKSILPTDPVSKLEIKALEDKISELEKKESKEPADYKTVKEEIIRIAKETKALQEKGLAVANMDFKSKVNKFIEDNATKIKEIKAAGTGFIELELKAADTIVTTSASNPSPGIPDLIGVQVAPPTRVNLRSAIIDGLVNLFNTGLAAYPYTESLPKDGDFSFVGEKGTATKVDLKIETCYAQPKKIMAYEILSDESIQDIPGLQSIATGMLKDKHDLKRQTGLLFGDGTGDNPKGATKYGRAFIAGGMAGKVKNPNFMDKVNACITDIFTTHNYVDEIPYLANIVMINPIDFYTELVAAKDAFGHPLYPMASLFNRVVIGGALIIPFEHASLPAGKVFVSDMGKYNVTNYQPYTVKIGYINDNLITGQFVILGQSRFHAFVKKLDEQAFIIDDLDAITLAIQGV